MDDLHTLLRPLVDRPETAPEPVERIAGRARRRVRRRRGLQAATAAVVLAVPTLLMVRRESGVDTETGPADTASTTSPALPAGPSTTAPSTTALPTASPAVADPFGPAAPWAGAPLPASAAPAYVDAAASDPEAAAKCPVVAPDDLGDGAGATPRMSTRGQGGGLPRWGVEYDLAGAPGTPDDGAMPTPDAGRNTFSVDAVVMPPVPEGMGESLGAGTVSELVTNRPTTHTWSDGSVAGWGGDLVGAALPPSRTEASGPGEPQESFVQFQVQGADPSCLYSVHSYLGDEHAFHLVDHLRRVEGT